MIWKIDYFLQSAWMVALQLTTSVRASVPASTIGLFFSRSALPFLGSYYYCRDLSPLFGAIFNSLELCHNLT